MQSEPDGCVWVVIAAYNEAGVIARVVADVRRRGYPVVVVDDGSADVTYWFGGKLRVIQTGRIQQYLMYALVAFIAIGAALYYFLLA